MVRNYIDTLVSLPWKKKSKLKKTLKQAEEILENDHYGLEKVKERILEYLAVQQRVGHAKGSETADFCVSTMAPSLLAKVKNNFTPAYAGAIARIVDAAAFKLGWQATRRFWEQDDEIYGGISWTDHPIRQIPGEFLRD